MCNLQQVRDPGHPMPEVQRSSQLRLFERAILDQDTKLDPGGETKIEKLKFHIGNQQAFCNAT